MSWRYSACFSFTSPNIRSASTSEKPRIAFSGVRSSWDMLARNSDLWRLAASSCRLLSAISRKRRAFWMASADWVAKVWSSSMTSGANAPGVFRLTVSPPISWSSRSMRYGEHRAGPRAEEDVAEGPAIGVLRRDVGNLDRLARHRHAPLDALPFAGRRAPGERHHLLVKIVGGAEVEGFGRLVVLEDGAGVGPGQLAGAGHDGLEHRVQIEGRAERPADIAERPELAHRARQVLRSGLRAP